MKKTKEQKGITLIALIITIVVLMVLAAVAISSIQNDGIIGHAQNATNKFTQEQQKEQDMLNYYELVLSGKAWTQNGTTVTRGNVTLQVGETITAKSGDTTVDLPKDKNGTTIEWKVLGVEYGKLLLMSASNIGTVSLEVSEGDWDNTSNSFLKQENQLHQFCKDTVTQNIDYVDEIRSVKVEDINRVTGFTPPPSGAPITYTSNFKHPDGRKIEKEGDAPITLVSNRYSYFGSSELPTTEDPNSLALNLLFKKPTTSGDTTTYSNDSYCLASSYVDAYSSYAYFGLRDVDSGYVSNNVSLWYSYDGSGGNR